MNLLCAKSTAYNSHLQETVETTMKNLKYLIALFPLIAFSQTGKLSGNVVFRESNLPVPGLNFQFIKDDKVIYDGTSDINGNYNFKNIPVGTYDLRLNYLGYRDVKFSNFKITENPKSMAFTFPKPCVESNKKCPKGHTSNLIPIVYGLPGEKLRKKSEKGKVKLGGCVVSDCDPKWFCKEHNLEF